VAGIARGNYDAADSQDYAPSGAPDGRIRW
jgi:hypothetical protein